MDIKERTEWMKTISEELTGVIFESPTGQKIWAEANRMIKEEYGWDPTNPDTDAQENLTCVVQGNLFAQILGKIIAGL